MQKDPYVQDMEDTLSQIARALGVPHGHPEALIAKAKELGSKQEGAGTVEARFHALLAGLEQRFPDASPFSASPPEERYLALVDEAVAAAARPGKDVPPYGAEDGSGHFEYIGTICEAYRAGEAAGKAGKPLRNPHTSIEKADLSCAFEWGHIAGKTPAVRSGRFQ